MNDTISRRIDHITSIPYKYYNRVIPAPPSVKMELTSKCNFRCRFCAHRLSSKEHGHMDRDFYSRIIREMRQAGVEELGVFYIGESMLCPWLAEGIREAKEVGFPYVFLTTNGSLATHENVKELMEAGLDSLKWSLNSADTWQFQRLTGMPGKMFHQILENVRSAWKIREEGGYKTKLYASSIRYDGEQLERMEEVVEQIRPYVDEHYWLPLLSFGGSASVDGKPPVVGNPGRLETMRAPMPCWAVFREGHITAEGKLSACCFDGSNQWITADLNEVSFLEGWNSEEFKNLREAHLKKDVHGTACEACIYGDKG